MKSISLSYLKVENRYSMLSKNSSKNIYKNFGENDLFLKIANGNCIVKIRINNKCGFPRIVFKHLKSIDVCVAKFPNSDDLLILKKDDSNSSFTIDIYKKSWKYRTLIISDF